MVNVRAKQYRIALWTRTAANEAVQVAIAKQIKEVLQLPENAKIGFMAHVRWGWFVLLRVENGVVVEMLGRRLRCLVSL